VAGCWYSCCFIVCLWITAGAVVLIPTPAFSFELRKPRPCHGTRADGARCLGGSTWTRHNAAHRRLLYESRNLKAGWLVERWDGLPRPSARSHCATHDPRPPTAVFFSGLTSCRPRPEFAAVAAVALRAAQCSYRLYPATPAPFRLETRASPRPRLFAPSQRTLPQSADNARPEIRYLARRAPHYFSILVQHYSQRRPPKIVPH